MGGRVSVTARRTLLVRLSTLPLDVRLQAAREAAKDEVDLNEKAGLLAAAIHPRPEHDLHWVHPDAAELLRKLKAAA